ncbi:MAG: hypothetical protein ACOYK1_06305 [Vampirovibrionia bacterium]|jgi:hypothetical protein
MNKLLKIFTSLVLVCGFTSVLNACNVSKAPETVEDQVEAVDVEEVEATAEAAPATEEAAAAPATTAPEKSAH